MIREVRQELRAKAQRGDAEAFAGLIAPHAAFIFAVVRRCLLSEAAALEVLEASALDLFAERDQWTEGLDREWLRRAARRAFSRAPPGTAAAPELAAAPLAGRDWPEDSEALRPALEASLRELPAGARTAVVLRDAGGLEDGEIAAASGLEALAARRLVHTGRCALTRAIDRSLS